ncbi:MAG: hypothetical protein K9I94_02960 [Bacteroidales bacterium]|nr:hypothetical protein [Bacteroidales bacterium]
MKRSVLQLSVWVISLMFISFQGFAQQSLDNHLEQFSPYTGKTYKGVFKKTEDGKPVYDVQQWERALNGKAIRIMHSVNNGEYGGETLMLWDKEKESIVFYYFTTAGFYTHGTMHFENGKFIGHEKVTGNEDGITEVRTSGEQLEDGRLVAKSKYLKNGEWVPGHEIIYEEAPGAEVILK